MQHNGGYAAHPPNAYAPHHPNGAYAYPYPQHGAPDQSQHHQYAAPPNQQYYHPGNSGGDGGFSGQGFPQQQQYGANHEHFQQHGQQGYPQDQHHQQGHYGQHQQYHAYPPPHPHGAQQAPQAPYAHQQPPQPPYPPQQHAPMPPYPPTPPRPAPPFHHHPALQHPPRPPPPDSAPPLGSFVPPAAGSSHDPAPFSHPPSCRCPPCNQFKALDAQTQAIVRQRHQQHQLNSPAAPNAVVRASAAFPPSQFPPQNPPPPTRPPPVTAADILRRPGRLKRPERIIVVLRGLPGSGKSRVARTLRDIEVANGGEAPRVLSLDDYFLQEVEVMKMDEETGKEVKGAEMEFVYEAEMEDVYKASCLKAFKRTLEEALYRFIIIDSPNIRVEDFEEYWSHGKMKGYEVYVMEIQATVQECAQRNVHGRTRDEISLLAQEYEATPHRFLRLEGLERVLTADSLGSNDVEEVEMDQEDAGEEEEALPSRAMLGQGDAEAGGAGAGAAGGGGRKSKWADDEDDDEDDAGADRMNISDDKGKGKAAVAGFPSAPKPLKSLLKPPSARRRSPPPPPEEAPPPPEAKSTRRKSKWEDTPGSDRGSAEGRGKAQAGAGAEATGLGQLLGDVGGEEEEEEEEEEDLLSMMHSYGGGGDGGGAAAKEEEESEMGERGSARGPGDGGRKQKRGVRWKDEEEGDLESVDAKRQRLRDAGHQALQPVSPWAQKLKEEQMAFAAAMAAAGGLSDDDG